MSAKNEETAQATLNRWVAISKESALRAKETRPANPSACKNMQECQRWRVQIVKEISKKVSEIQNASLGEETIRHLNDEINALFTEKKSWERRIKYLGGPDYQKISENLGKNGCEVPNSGGYKYFGAAKDLPGIREIFFNKPPNVDRKDNIKNIDLFYYGIGDDLQEIDFIKNN